MMHFIAAIRSWVIQRRAALSVTVLLNFSSMKLSRCVPLGTMNMTAANLLHSKHCSREHVSSLQVADIICPNVLELEMLSGVTISSFDDVVVAARALLARGPSFVLVKHLGMSDIDRTACCTSRAHSIFSGRNLAVCVHYVRIPGRIGARSTRSGKAASFEMLLVR